MYLYTISIHLMVCLLATLHHPDYKGFRNAPITSKGIRQGASKPDHELYLNSTLAPINYHQKPWAEKTTIETTGHSLYSYPKNAGIISETTGHSWYSCDKKACTTNETTGQSLYSCPGNNCTTNETTEHSLYSCTGNNCTTHETTEHSLYSCTGNACATNETTGPSLYNRTEEIIAIHHPTPLVQTRPPASIQGTVIQKKDKDATALGCKTRDATARLKSHQTQVAELRSEKSAGASDLLWKMMADVTKGAEESWEEAAGLVFLAFCCWVYGIDWLLPISVTQLLQIIFGVGHEWRSAQRTYRWKHYDNVPELVTGRGSTKKRARLFRRYLKGKQ